ncbi:hypothetical protein GCM10020367_33980 [Streptomyces sannanensis]|uniref:Uncharacterized protein n=1 Tax=Streptomyces sannanensis TaxID=285536 RepID=A0ABP6SD70_9ACTN
MSKRMLRSVLALAIAGAAALAVMAPLDPGWGASPTLSADPGWGLSAPQAELDPGWGTAKPASTEA